MSEQVLAPGVMYEGDVWQGLDLVDADAEGARFIDCTMRSSVLSGGSYERTAWRGSRLEGVRFVGAGLVRSHWLDVDLDGCGFSGCEAFGSDVRRVRVRGGRFDTVNLRGAHLREVVFEDCLLREVDFGGARLIGVRMPGCRIERLELTGATLDRVDFRGAALDIVGGVDRLRGAVLDPGQLLELAPALARHIGIEIRPLGD